MQESWYAELEKVILPLEVEILKRGPVEPSGRIPIRKLKYKQLILSIKKPNNTVYLDDKKIMCIDSMYILSNTRESDIVLIGAIVWIVKPMFTYPSDSSKLNMWQVRPTETKMRCLLQSVIYKMVHVTLQFDDTNEDSEDDDTETSKSFVIPLLHM